jgi:hypothetical protein
VRTKIARAWQAVFEDARRTHGVEEALDLAAACLHEQHGVRLRLHEGVVEATLPGGSVVELRDADALTPSARLRLTARLVDSIRVRDLWR